MNDLHALLEGAAIEADKFDQVDKDDASLLSNLIRRSIDIDDQIKDAEQHLKDLKFKKHKINTEDIPALMESMGGLTTIEVDDHKVKLRNYVHARIPENRKQEAYAFLRSIGEQSIIKNEVTVSFDRGQDNMAGDLVGELNNRGLEPNQKTHIHPMTLKGWCKDRIDQGKELDFDLFGIHAGVEAKVTRS